MFDKPGRDSAGEPPVHTARWFTDTGHTPDELVIL